MAISNAVLILDISNLAWRAHHAIGALSHKGQETNILFGIFRDIVLLQKRFETHQIVFCFDLGKSKRCELYPQYKQNRRGKYESLSKTEKATMAKVQKQIQLLRLEYLPALGFQNVFGEEGYEADDIIASVCKYTITKEQNGIIVSSDKDLYQLLRRNIIITQPQQNKTMTKQSFWKEFGIAPKQWCKTKSIMGDSGDGIPGIKGVGLVKALQWVNNELPTKTQKQKELLSIIKTYKEAGYLRRNYALVKLPYPGTPQYELQEDTCTKKKWKSLMSSLGMKSLRKIYPLSVLNHV